MPYRFHLLAVPHTISTPEYSTCAFTQKVVKMTKMLKACGHTVIHYGHEDSTVACDENVAVTTNEDLATSYPGHDWRTQGWPAATPEDHVYQVFYQNTIAALEERKQPGDFLLCTGARHKPVAEAHPDLIAIEPGIGYPNGGFARFRVFESYAALHGYRGMKDIEFAADDWWYDAVIPNYFDLDDFDYCADKDDYFLFLGRVSSAKGINVAMQVAQAAGKKLLIAGAGQLNGDETVGDPPPSEFATLLGPVGPAERRTLLAKAKAVLAPSQFLEPFCGVQIEAMLSGTPVISTDWGAFAEYNIHGVTGYRCRNFDQFLWAANNIDTIDPINCRTWAERNFSLDRVGGMYDEYFASVANIFNGQGWYEPNPDRTDLNWLYKYPPVNRVE
jgi:glycosyltransferase involved in cell wall biosynthesis